MKMKKKNGWLHSFLNAKVLKNEGVVPRREGILYSAGIAGQNVSCGMVGWFYYFCTDVAYYDLRVIAIVITLARVWDAVNDPMMGVLIDRHRFKNGEKLRPWLKIAPVIAGVMAALMFFKPAAADHNLYIQAIFILLIYLVYDMSFTVQDISMWGMTAVMSPKSGERSILAQWGRIGGTVGSWLPGLITVFVSIANKIGFPQQYLFLILGVVLGFGGMMLSMISSCAQERVISVPDKENNTIKSNLGLLFKNKMVMLVLIGSILSGLSLGIPQLYFFKYKVSIDLFGMQMDGIGFSFIFGIISGLPATLSMLVANRVGKKIGGMKNILILSCLSAIVMRILCFAVGYEGNKILIIMLIMAVGSIPTGMTGIAMTSLFGDSIDYMEWKTGQRGEAITFAAQTFCSKIVGAINSGVTTVLFMALDYSAEAYDAGLPLSPAFDRWVWPLFMLGPIVGSVLNLFPLLFIRYPNSLKAQVETELKARREKQEVAVEAGCGGKDEL